MNDKLLCNGLFGKTRQAVLSLLYGQTDSSFYTKQVLDAVKIGRGAVQRELKNLTDTGIIIREVQGRQVYYRANEKCPIFGELKTLVSRTASMGVVREANASYNTKQNVFKSRFAIPKHTLAKLCRSHHIRKLALFGSVLRQDFGADSDIDILVEFEPGKTPGFAFFGIQEELSKMLGRKVDLNTMEDLSPYFRDKVAREAETLYDAG